MARRYELAIRGGRLVDGTGGPPEKLDVAVAGNRIAAVGKLRPGRNVTVLDARGLVVAPGFIDVHAHGDLTALVHPSAESKVTMGVTTELLGNCGDTPFPVSRRNRSAMEEAAERAGVALDWTDARGYLARLGKTGTAINRAILVGHGSVRTSVMAFSSASPGPKELERMKAEVAGAMDVGAFGLSTGLIYPPGCYAQTEEIVELARVAAGAGGMYSTHMRGEGDRLESAVDEALLIARESGARLQISHLKAAGVNNWPKVDWLEERLDRARSEGVDLAADRYPYVASSTSLSSLLPDWAREGGREKELERLKSVKLRERIAGEIGKKHAGKEAWSRVVVAAVCEDALREMEGRSLTDVAEAWSLEPVAAFFEFLLRDRSRTSAVYFSMSEKNLERVLRLPYVAVGSDASARAFQGPDCTGKPHPRFAGSFTRILGRYVRERGVLSLEEAVRKMTSLPASRIGLRDRGAIAVGRAADVVVFDPERVSDRATFADPYRASVGMTHVLVNGVFVVRDNELTGARPGRVLRRA